MSSATKRRIDSLFESLPAKRSPSVLREYRTQLNELLSRKEAWMLRQKRSSLLVDPCRVDEECVMSEFSTLYRAVSTIATEPEEHKAQLALIEDIIRESIVVEWPRQVYGILGSSSDESVEVDQAPLIHRARNVVKCRTSHPTMRIKVYAMTSSSHERSSFSLPSIPCAPPTVVESFFRATLTKALLGPEMQNAQVAGRMILTQREGTAASKSAERSGAVVTSDGKLVASHAAPDNHTYILLARYGEQNVRTTSLKYENGVLCATYPEMGVTLNSMVDRRQLATRYAIQLEVGINIDNKLIVQHTMQSLPFLIAITNDQTEPLLYSIVWSRLLERENADGTEPQNDIPWRILRQAITNFIKSQLKHARSLYRRELLHIQAMLFLPRVVRSRSAAELVALSRQLFPHSAEVDPEGMKLRAFRDSLRRRLLEEDVDDDVLVGKNDFMTDRCISLLDGRTELRHTTWQWLFKATEMILDVGHKLCPSPSVVDKKTSKTKKQVTASDECHTVMSLFNKGYLSFCSVFDLMDAYRTQAGEEGNTCEDDNGAIFIRFDDENAGHFSLGFGTEERTDDSSERPLRPIMGSISAESIKELKQGLPEFLMDESWPARHGRLFRVTSLDRTSNKLIYSTLRKRALFNTYQSLRCSDDHLWVVDDESTLRVNVRTGVRLERKQQLLTRLPLLDDDDVIASTSAVSEGNLAGSLAMSPFASLAPATPLNNALSVAQLPPQFAQLFAILVQSAGMNMDDIAKLANAIPAEAAAASVAGDTTASETQSNLTPVNSPPKNLDDILRQTEEHD